MSRKAKVGRLRRAIRRGRARIHRIATYDRRRRAAIRRLLAEQSAIVMFDDVDTRLIPDSAPAAAGYVDGTWPTYRPLRERFPDRPVLAIAVSAGHDAHCLDVETGDAAVAEVPGWIVRQQEGWAGSRWRPCVYASKAVVPQVIAVCAAAGIGREEYRIWAADWTYQPHICSPASCGASFTAEATQWTDRAAGVSLDQSLCSAEFFPGSR